MLISVIIRTLNEERYLGELLESISSQKVNNFEVEVVIIDSGSTDKTLEISKKYDCRITYIDKNIFSFGRSLNIGSKFSNGAILVFISGHCIPVDNNWLEELVSPLINGKSDYVYGRQTGRDTTKYSEQKHFESFFPGPQIKTEVGYCNNANAAILRNIWEPNKFDENITGLEDIELAERLILKGKKINYVSSACVYHIHDENWLQTFRRYERESVALKFIYPELNFGFYDFVKFVSFFIYNDLSEAVKEKVFFREFISIVKFRTAQFSGTLRGSKRKKEISKYIKEKYFYPRRKS